MRKLDCARLRNVPTGPLSSGGVFIAESAARQEWPVDGLRSGTHVPPQCRSSTGFTQNSRIDGTVHMLKAVSGVSLPIIIAIVATLALTGNLFGASPVLIAVQLVAVALSVSARRSFPRGSFRVVAAPGGETLLRKGPYRFIRHPMYSAALLLIWSGILAHISFLTVSLGVLATGVAAIRIIVEERLLRERYSDYGHYAKTTKAVIPFVV